MANAFMLVTYWQLNTRILDEQEYGYAHLEESISAAHHHHSHHHYPSNYSLQMQAPVVHPEIPRTKIQTPVPKLLSPRIDDFIQIKADKFSKSSTPDSSTEYKSFPISPLDINGTSRYLVV